MTGTAFCSQHNIVSIDLLKIDVEGFEMEVLNGFSEDFLRSQVKFIYSEVGFDKDDRLKTHFSILAAYLSDRNFILSGFYEPFRWGTSKLKLGFCNVLFVNLNYERS
jgi:hypothetical protein